MPGKEGQPYQFKHHKQVSLDGYRGVASDLMELHDPTADGFMRVSDMRSDIVVTTMPRDRVHEYDQLGYVRIAKLVKLPKLDLWKKDGLVHTVRRDGVWMIAVNDQQLSDEVAISDNNGKRFDEAFTQRFAQELARGLKTCLKKEKLFNSGEYNLTFYLGYLSMLKLNLSATVYPGLSALSGNTPPLDALATAVALNLGVNAFANGMGLAGAGLNMLEERVEAKPGLPKGKKIILPAFNDPIVKHSPLELVAFPIAFDRVARGVIHLNKHGNELIDTPSKTSESI